jgi:flavin-dependent dehydrogenase
MNGRDFDAIVIGARVAGASTAMLLARRGLRVLAVDRASFPSDTLSTHQVQLPGVAALERWGLLEHVIAAGTPPVREVGFDPGPLVLRGAVGTLGGADAIYGPRRQILDKLLVDAARDAGVQVRERFVVDEIVTDSGRVMGIRGREPGAAAVLERARIVIGADGRHSLLAKAVGPRAYNVKPPLTFAYYTYWDGLEPAGGEMYGREDRLIGVWPTNHGQAMTYVAGPIDEFHRFRADIEANALQSFDLVGDLGERVRAATRAERWFGTAETGNYFRVPYGPGWALVGDAGLAMDPVTAQGISDAFRDAELLSEAVANGFEDGRLERTLRGYQRERDRAVKPMYDMTVDVASLGPIRIEQRLLYEAVERDPAAAERFLQVLTGAVPVREYFNPGSLRRLLGVRGLVRIIASQVAAGGSSARPRRAVSEA